MVFYRRLIDLMGKFWLEVSLEPSCCKEWLKKSRARNRFGNGGRFKVLNDTKLIQNDPIHAHLGPIWYYSEPSDVPHSPNQFHDLGFFCQFLQQDCSSSCCWAKFTFSNFLLLILPAIKRWYEMSEENIQGVSKVFRHLKWAVCGELVHLDFFWGNTKWKKYHPHIIWKF